MGARRVIDRALADQEIAPLLLTRPTHVIAVGKAAAAMAAAYHQAASVRPAAMLAIGTHGRELLPAGIEWIEAGHPFPDARSQAAGDRAVAIAQRVPSGEVLVILLSGGASALMAAPLDGISLEEKIATTRLMMNSGADIHALNTVRRHLSKVKGGRLAAECVGMTITIALSDVVGDDLCAIGSGPGVPDPTTWNDAAAALDRYGGEAHAPSVRFLVARGKSGKLPDTPKAGDSSMRRARAKVIGSRLNAMEGARDAALALGYRTMIDWDAVTGEARESAPKWLERVQRAAQNATPPMCFITSGETTVTVTGNGRGGRNLEFALALAEPLSSLASCSVASVGTDGIDGTSGVAGAIVDSTTLLRARERGLEAPGKYLATNDSLAFFAPLDDAVRLGRTDTNVGDLQVALID